jgi:hypothetical protein
MATYTVVNDPFIKSTKPQSRSLAKLGCRTAAWLASKVNP